MVTYVLDTSAALRFLDVEAGWEKVRTIVDASLREQCRIQMSVINWGELVGKLYKRHGLTLAQHNLAQFRRVGIEVVVATEERCIAAAILSARLQVSYADAFGIELASAPDHILVTADYGAKPAAAEVVIDFLPPKQPA